MPSSPPPRIYAKPGDLVKDTADDEIGLVLGYPEHWEPRTAGYLIQWPSVSYPIEMDESALQNGWGVVGSRVDVPTV